MFCWTQCLTSQEVHELQHLPLPSIPCCLSCVSCSFGMQTFWLTERHLFLLQLNAAEESYHSILTFVFRSDLFTLCYCSETWTACVAFVPSIRYFTAKGELPLVVWIVVGSWFLCTWSRKVRTTWIFRRYGGRLIMMSSKNRIWSELPSTLQELIHTCAPGACFSQAESFLG